VLNTHMSFCSCPQSSSIQESIQKTRQFTIIINITTKNQLRQYPITHQQYRDYHKKVYDKVIAYLLFSASTTTIAACRSR